MRFLLAPTLLTFGALACGGTTFPGPQQDASLDVTTIDAGTDTGALDAGPDSGGGACDGGACGIGLQCCGGACKNEMNDPLNCGKCGQVCTGSNPMCIAGHCEAQTCAPRCSDLQVCCLVEQGGPSSPPSCYPGTTCPVGCPACN